MSDGPRDAPPTGAVLLRLLGSALAVGAGVAALVIAILLVKGAL
jgi:hypothetical protein